MRSTKLLAILGLSILAVGCGGPEVTDLSSGGSTGGGGNETPTPTPVASGSFVVAVTSAPLVMDLNVASSVGFTVTPSDGFTGTVNVSIAPNAAGLLGTPTTVTVDGAAPVSGSIDVDTTVHKDVVPGRYTDIALTATGGGVTATAMVEATINPALLLHVKAGAGLTPATDVWGPDASATGDGIILHFGKDAAGAPNPTFQIAWINDDAQNHTIHAGGNASQHGIQHGATNVNNSDVNGNQGGTQTRTINRNGTVLDPADPADQVVLQPNTFYCHNHLDAGITGHAAKITLRN